MSETRTVFDPFELKAVEVSNRLVDRLRGKYASGPHLPNGKPEFGWRQFEAPPIQHEAAAEIDRLTSRIEELTEALKPFALLVDDYTGFEGDDYVAITTRDGITIRVGQLRKARSALEAINKGGK